MLPGPFPEQSQPVAGKDPGLGKAAVIQYPFSGRFEDRTVRVQTGNTQGNIGFNRGIDVAGGSLVVYLPGTVLTLFVDNGLDHALVFGVILHAKDMHGHDPFRFHAGIGLESSDPESLVILVIEQPGRCPLDGLFHVLLVVQLFSCPYVDSWDGIDLCGAE